jgi:hypothetical protein
MKAVSHHRRVQLFFADDHQDNVCDDANGIPRSMIARALRA